MIKPILLFLAFLMFSFAGVTSHAAGQPDGGARPDYMGQLDGIDKLYQAGDADKADAQLENVLTAVRAAAERSPKVIILQRALGRALAFHGDAADALAVREGVVQLAPDDADGWFELGQSQVGAEKNEEALRSFEKAAKLNPKHAKAALMAGAMLSGEKKDDEAMSWFKKAAEIDPNYPLAHANIGQIYQNQGKFAESLAAYQVAAKLSPDDPRWKSKLIQNCQTLGKAKERDQARKELLALFSAGKIREPFYCREQFTSGKARVMAFEYYELAGDRAVRYSFTVIPEGELKPKYRISLGSYESTNEIAREQGEIKPDERLFHLDGYYPGDEHRTYAMYKAEPTYEQTRLQVVAAIEGKLKPISSSKGPEMQMEK